MVGKANFGFVAKYKKGSYIPEGSTEYQFHAAGFNFNSSSYEAARLVIPGAKANYKGEGTINGSGNYGFLVSAIDGQITGGGIDKFRIRIWDKNNGDFIVYDNNLLNTAEDADPATAISGGLIVIFETKKGTSVNRATARIRSRSREYPKEIQRKSEENGIISVV